LWNWKHGASRKVKPFFFVKLGDNAITTHGKLQQSFGDDAMSRAQAFRWQKMFSEGKNPVEDEQRSGRPSTAGKVTTQNLFNPIED
jgi:hypothetical protein